MATLICMSVFVSCGGGKQSGNKNGGNQDSVESSSENDGEKPVDSGDVDSTTETDVNDTFVGVNDIEKTVVRDFIRNSFQILNNDNCKELEWRNNSECYDEIKIGSKFDSTLKGDAIAVVEVFSEIEQYENYFVGAMRKKFQAYYRFNYNNYTFSKQEIEVKIPKALNKIFSEAGGLSPYVPMINMDPTHNLFTELSKYKFLSGFHHANLTINQLVVYNPDSPIVFIDFPIVSKLNGFCSFFENEELFRDSIKQSADSLKKVIKVEGISFVNMSMGHSYNNVQKEYNNSCKDSDGRGINISKTQAQDILREIKILKDVLFNSDNEDLLTVQAGFNLGVEDVFDCSKEIYNSRVVAGGFSELEPNIKEYGIDINKSHRRAYTSGECVDFYFNTGVVRTRPFPYNNNPTLESDASGLFLTPYSGVPQTSWQTPMVLTYLNYLKHSQNQREKNLYLDIKNNKNNSRGKYLDALKYGHSRAAALGYARVTNFRENIIKE